MIWLGSRPRGRLCDRFGCHDRDTPPTGREEAFMSTLSALADALTGGSVEVVALTAPLSAEPPIIQPPPDAGQTATFARQGISRYDDRGPALRRHHRRA